ncbi:hypothetical protein BD560DRAFT_384090 [Blakeslea trispora]|nr:hypothetical protein BD560DRAFT_384090 [Blakeslea trispora]
MDYIHYKPSEDVHLVEDTDDEMDMEATGSHEMIVDLDVMTQHELANITKAVNGISQEMKTASLCRSSKYKKYGQGQIERFIRIKQEEGMSVPKAAALCGIPRSTAYELINKFNAGNGTVLPGKNLKKPSMRPKKLFTQHSAFLIELYNQNPSTAIEEARTKLCEAFPGLEVSTSGLYKHIREKCALSLRQTTKRIAE